MEKMICKGCGKQYVEYRWLIRHQCQCIGYRKVVRLEKVVENAKENRNRKIIEEREKYMKEIEILRKQIEIKEHKEKTTIQELERITNESEVTKIHYGEKINMLNDIISYGKEQLNKKDEQIDKVLNIAEKIVENIITPESVLRDGINYLVTKNDLLNNETKYNFFVNKLMPLIDNHIPKDEEKEQYTCSVNIILKKLNDNDVDLSNYVLSLLKEKEKEIITD